MNETGEVTELARISIQGSVISDKHLQFLPLHI